MIKNAVIQNEELFLPLQYIVKYLLVHTHTNKPIVPHKIKYRLKGNNEGVGVHSHQPWAVRDRLLHHHVGAV